MHSYHYFILRFRNGKISKVANWAYKQTLAYLFMTTLRLSIHKILTQ
jgi:pyoverdine/dityrosine biosynthesis protein Dit1